ncbi:MAG TPA: hypothetical protein VGK20_09890 [Candidatus Binatia bacterium]|jgi:hypothetical protein
MPRYADDLTLRLARRQYFDANGFGEGGYDEKWVKVKIGPLPFAFPNTAQRVRSVRLHDLHHVVTDYGTDMTGESEIGAWEIASGCRDHWAAWVLNLSAFGLGLLIAPRAMWTAFARGRHSANLYDGEYDEALLDESVRSLRSRLRLGAAAPAANATDVLAFVAWSLAGILVFGTALALTLAPLVLIVASLLRLLMH